MYVVQLLVDVLLLAVEEFDLLVDPVSDGLVCSFIVLLFVATDLDVYVAWFDLFYSAHFVEPYGCEDSLSANKFSVVLK
jgi:hypothetical protein